jgi:hypothetical protein
MEAKINNIENNLMNNIENETEIIIQNVCEIQERIIEMITWS